ncbi:LamG-like jellyroll fold domain-containing protein [Streptomyces sp. NPDC058961]|uniref:LamG-like jellyroll fold domain-containing protein n=1 Tax=Streptomyces sp. NPDC058961 TaxID=3346680 RepID=UPI0036C3112D
MRGNNAYTRGRNTSHRRRSAGLITAVLAAAAAALPTPALADDAPNPAQGDALHQAQIPPDEQASTQALAQAQASGKPVVIDTLTTPYAQTVANPNGTLTRFTSPTPTRAKTNGHWSEVDSTLQVNSDGSLSPKMVVNSLTLSGGGSGPLATLTSPRGRSLAVTMPFALPKPTASGSTATYADVLPDIDLNVTATEIGGIREVLVVKTADAAKNPALATLHLGTAGDGLTMKTDGSGALQAVDVSTNNPEFAAPVPQMWDSSTASTSGSTPRALQHTANAAKFTAQSLAEESGNASSTLDGPGIGAQTAAMPIRVAPGSVDITPVADILHGSGTHYPVFIDPDYLPWRPGDPTWTWTQSAHPGTSNFGDYGSTHSSQPGLGVCGTSYPGGGGCDAQDTERTYYQFDTSALAIHHDVLGSAVLTVNQTYSADWDCNSTYGVRLTYSSDTIGPGTTWNNHPSDAGTGLTDQVGGTGSSGCMGNVPFAYDVTGVVQNGANRGWSTLVFGLYGDEGNVNGFKRLSNKATLAITYDQVPNIPTGLTSSPIPGYASSGTNQPCEATTNPTDRAFVGVPGLAQGLQLKATVSSPTAPAQPVRGYFSLWDDSVKGFPSTAHGTGYSSGGGYTSSGNQVSFALPQDDLTDGHAYAWDASTSDGILASANSSVCHFRVDLTPPTVTTPTASDQVTDPTTTFPPAGNKQTTSLHVGQSGTVPFTATDPNPSVGVASGLACVRSGFDPTLAGAAWQCGTNRPNGTLKVTPTHWGTNILYIQAQDNAGNYSQTASYAFYVPWNPNGPAPVFGDTTGDSSPDIVTAHSDGNLYAHTVPGNTQATSPAVSLAAIAANSPTGDSWKTYTVSHRGSLRGGSNVDGLFAHQTSSPRLYYYNNPGVTGANGRFDKYNTLAKPPCSDDGSGGSCTGYATDWSTTTQIAALGDPSTTALSAGTFQNRTGLLTEEANASGDATLWFYPAISDTRLGSPVRLAATGWKNLDLLTPGDWNHTGRPGLWARNRTTGDINAYALTPGTTPTPDGSQTVPTITAISAGAKIGNLSATDYPIVGSDSDITGDGIPDLWAVGSNGQLSTWPGRTSDGTTSTAVSSFNAALNAGTTLIAANQWSLAGYLADTGATNPATASGTSTWSPNHTGTNPGAITFDGTGSNYLHTAGPALDTTRSYTVSAWVKLNTLDRTQVAVSQGTANHQAFYLGYSSNKTWQFMTTTSEAASTDYPVATGGPVPTTGTWTHLTGVYDTDSHVQSLYVNGVLCQRAATNSSPAYNPTAPLTVGANITVNSGNPYDAINGSVSDVRTYPAALTAAQIQSLYTHS